MDFENVSPESFRQYQNDHDEKAYLLVDVRQPEEYETAHIPGAKLMPLDDLEANLGALPTDKDIVFY
jgi:rhodanese-related sulfurtransferase